MKPESRILGIDDGPFNKFSGCKRALVVGALFRGCHFLDGVLSTTAEVDGLDATANIINMIKRSRFYAQIRIILFKGIAVGGFNILDIKEIHRKTRIPVIIFMRRLPDLEKIKGALSNLPLSEKRWLLIRKAGRIYTIRIFHRDSEKQAYLQLAGIKLCEAEPIIRASCTHSAIPEPLRIAHIIASGIIKGESRGKA
ncbi:MAG: DUF99 family protein [Candidatus Woesearchaeota archaeon]